MPSHLKEAGGLQPRLDLIGGSERLEEGKGGWGEPWGRKRGGHRHRGGAVAAIRGQGGMLFLKPSCRWGQCSRGKVPLSLLGCAASVFKNKTKCKQNEKLEISTFAFLWLRKVRPLCVAQQDRGDRMVSQALSPALGQPVKWEGREGAQERLTKEGFSRKMRRILGRSRVSESCPWEGLAAFKHRICSPALNVVSCSVLYHNLIRSLKP